MSMQTIGEIFVAVSFWGIAIYAIYKNHQIEKKYGWHEDAKTK